MVRRTIDPVLGEYPSSQDILGIKICDPAMGTGAFLIESCRYLSNRLVEVWQREGQTQEGKSKEERLVLARCLIAKHCLYGVDKNPKAVELGRWSLWLAMENPDIPLDYFDQNLKYGDAVVGCTVEQISVFDWSQKDNTQSKLNPLIQKIKTYKKF